MLQNARHKMGDASLNAMTAEKHISARTFWRLKYSTQHAMRYYREKYPEVDELVMVQVRQIAEMGAYVKLVSTC